ncbi:hypothetical protein E2C01_091821 [Portunus trituberculatus]|uniref:Uncharacterized protein n=1 Tax=Portunus trituberculatus TaxID=210409 RepID=A0A5B7JTW4_PORTR|nr:hypothetical protein [Portunus trituberculatus]
MNEVRTRGRHAAGRVGWGGSARISVCESQCLQQYLPSHHNNVGASATHWTPPVRHPMVTGTMACPFNSAACEGPVPLATMNST